MKKVNSWIFLGLFLVLLILFSWSKSYNKNNQGFVSVPCLFPNLPLVTHIHPEIIIEIDGENQKIPENIGLTKECERAIHTHNDGDGLIHIESQTNQVYTLGDFFSVWGEKIKKENYTLEMTVNGEASTALDKLILEDKQKIKLSYIKIIK